MDRINVKMALQGAALAALMFILGGCIIAAEPYPYAYSDSSPYYSPSPYYSAPAPYYSPRPYYTPGPYSYSYRAYPYYYPYYGYRPYYR
jgi:hypothetical protein